MNYRERVAHHEAAHVVLAFLSSAGIPERGIDLDAKTSVDGAYGNALVNLFDDDTSLDIEERKNLLLNSLAIVCAGAASDAKLMGRPLREALRLQRGDESVALKLLEGSTLIEAKDKDTRQEEQEIVLDVALKLAERELEKPIVWDAVQQIARASLEGRGRLSKQQIEVILASVFPDSAASQPPSRWNPQKPGNDPPPRR